MHELSFGKTGQPFFGQTILNKKTMGTEPGQKNFLVRRTFYCKEGSSD